MFEVIVLGATFLAAGIAQRYQKECLVIERRAKAGYEFFGTYGSEAHIYPCFKEAVTLFNTEIVSVTRTVSGFSCLTHGVSGYRCLEAKRVIDTRCTAQMSVSKSYNLLVESDKAPEFIGTSYEKGEMEQHYILKCEVPLSCDFIQARRVALNVIERFSENQRLILTADEFDYRVKADYPKTENGILYLPSKAYETPTLAFAAGLEGKEADK